ncbi:hypothetical protein ACL02S_09310 [Nocardia sp. 004]|uniref:hypothetical protein n=1 Tax=Nocardia sp. 004 TaxID=3385978 RepID=UPI0039A3E4DE
MGEDNVLVWKQLAGQARAGELYLDDERAAYLCAEACEKRITELFRLLEAAQRTKNVGGFGDFKMADALAKKFLKQATGEDNSIENVLREHIEVVQNMREVMAISFKRITGQDIENADRMAYVIEQVDR